MLCLSGFELYSRWVPLTHTHTKQKQQQQPNKKEKKRKIPAADILKGLYFHLSLLLLVSTKNSPAVARQVVIRLRFQ